MCGIATHRAAQQGTKQERHLSVCLQYRKIRQHTLALAHDYQRYGGQEASPAALPLGEERETTDEGEMKCWPDVLGLGDGTATKHEWISQEPQGMSHTHSHRAEGGLI